MILVIEILPASRGIFADHLQCARGARVNSNVGPCRRYFQTLYSLPISSVYFFSIGLLVTETTRRASQTLYSALLQLLKSCH